MTAPFDWTHIQSIEVLEAARRHRFTPELRPVLLGYLGMAPGMDVLEVCCGPGTLAPYLAEGVAPGTVTGLDLDRRFIERAQQKAADAGHKGVRYAVGDAYALPFPANSFDAVTSYTGIGVLADPGRALAEMIRVCRPGGTVSVAEAVAPASVTGSLEEASEVGLYPGAQEYLALSRRLQQLARTLLLPKEEIGSKQWPVPAFFGLMGRSGLERLRMNAWGYCYAGDDARVAEADRNSRRHAEHRREQEWLRALTGSEEGKLLADNGFGPTEVERLCELAEVRQRWLTANPFYDWSAGLSVIFAGTKPDPA